MFSPGAKEDTYSPKSFSLKLWIDSLLAKDGGALMIKSAGVRLESRSYELLFCRFTATPAVGTKA